MNCARVVTILARMFLIISRSWLKWASSTISVPAWTAARCASALTDKGNEIANQVASLYERHITSIEQVGGIQVEEFMAMNKSLQRLDRFWNDSIAYRL